MRKDGEDEVRKEERWKEEEEKGAAIFLNIEEGESNAAAFEEAKAAPSCFIRDFPKQATCSALPILPA